MHQTAFYGVLAVLIIITILLIIIAIMSSWKGALPAFCLPYLERSRYVAAELLRTHLFHRLAQLYTMDENAERDARIQELYLAINANNQRRYLAPMSDRVGQELANIASGTPDQLNAVTEEAAEQLSEQLGDRLSKDIIRSQLDAYHGAYRMMFAAVRAGQSGLKEGIELDEQARKTAELLLNAGC